MKKDVVNYDELSPIDGTYVVDNGLKLDRYETPSICSRPYRIDTDGDFIIVADHDKSAIFYVDKSFNLHKKYYTGDVSENRYPRCMVATNDKLYVGTDYNRLFCIDKATSNVDWDFGTYGSRGKCSDGKIGEVMQIQVLSDGKLVIATYEGAGDANRYYGTVELFENDGSWIKTLLQDEGTGYGADLQTHYPQTIRVYGDTVYVGKSNEIDVFTYDSANQDLTFIQTIRKPTNSGVDDLGLRDFVIVDDILYVTTPNLKKVVGFNLVTGEVEFSVGHFNYESTSTVKHEGNGLNYPDGIVVVDEHIYVADSSNYNVVEIFRDDYIYPQYDVPTNIDIIYSSLELDGNTAKVLVGEEPPKLNLVYKNKV